MISPATIEQVRAASDIVEVIGGYLPLKRAGGNFVGLCPFHKEKTPSFNVSPQRQFFHCFGCHKGGDVFTFICEYENLPFLDAVRRLAERAKIPIETGPGEGASQTRHLKDQLLAIHEQITQHWQAALASHASGQVARDYLAKRGVSPQAVQLFRLGCAPEAWDDTVNWAASKQFDLALVEQCGLIIRKEGSDRYYDRFRGRLMFPICDEQGRVIAFSGRVLTDEKTAKYVNSPENPLFTKGKVMFGLDKSKRAILDARTAVICEGQLDLIACFMAGVQNIVAPQGTAFTPDHARLLKRYADEVVLCFDSDQAGKDAAVRSFDLLLAAGLAARVAVIPAPHDPDSYIKEFGSAAFAKLIQGARDFFDYYLDRLCAENDLASDRGRRAVVQAMAEAAHKGGSPVVLDTCAQKTALRLGVPADVMRAEFRKAPRVRRPEDAAPEAPAAEPAVRPSGRELVFLRLLLENDAWVGWVAAHLDLAWITNPDVRDITAWRLRLEDDHSWPGLAAWMAQTDNAAWRGLITEMLVDNRPLPKPEIALKGAPGCDGVVKILRDKYIERQLAALRARFESPTLGEEETRQLQERQRELNHLRRQPLAPLHS